MFSKRPPKSSSDLIPEIAAGPAIPKIIHQVYASKDLPPIIQANIEKIRALNPDWDYRFYDDDDMVEFVKTTYGEPVLSYYNRINAKYGASRADFFRYLLIYRIGGLYLDIKGSIERPLDEVLRVDDVYLLSRWRNGRGERYEGWGKHGQLKEIGGEEFQQWFIAAAPGHPFLREVIEAVMRNIDRYNPFVHGTGKAGVLQVTGPIAYTRSITSLLDQCKYRLVDSHDDLGLIYSIFGGPNMRPHKSIFAFHYTALTEPVIHITGLNSLLWTLYAPFQNRLLIPVRSVFDALYRRFAANPVRRG